jgi:hypothetical protein
MDSQRSAAPTARRMDPATRIARPPPRRASDPEPENPGNGVVEREPAAASRKPRTSATLAGRRAGSFWSRRFRRSRSGAGVVAGRAAQSGSRSRIATRMSETLSPSNAFFPASIS